jgi:hypothetical protein
MLHRRSISDIALEYNLGESKPSESVETPSYFSY